jgi:hypothetical protein
MKNRPNELIVLTCVMAALAISVIIQMILLRNQDASAATWASYVLLLIVSAVHAVAVFKGSKFLLYTGSFFTVSFAWNGWASSGNIILPLIASTLIHAVLTTPQIRKVLRDQSSRWWRSYPRKFVQVRALIRPVEGGEFKSVTHDLSLGGAFFPFGEADWRSPHAPKAKHMRVGSRCNVQLVFNQLKMINCSAEIVRNAAQNGSYPGGFAVRFVGLEGTDRRVLSEIIDYKKA